MAASFAMRGVLSPVQEAARSELHLSDFQISLVQGLASSIPITVFSIPLGRLADRYSRVRLLIMLAVFTTAAQVLGALAHGFGLLFISRMLAGAGGMCMLPAAISIAADVSVPEQRGRALLLLTLGQYVGLAAAFALGGALFGLLGSDGAAFGLTPWRGVMLWFGIGSALLVAPLFGLREPARKEVGEAPSAALGPVLRELWTRKAFLLPLVIGQMSVVMADTAASIWAAPVLARNYGLRPEQAGGWMGLVILGAGIFGSVFGGAAADAGQRSRLRGGILVGAVAASAIALPAALFAVAPTPLMFALLLALLLVCGVVTGLVTSTALAVLVPNELRGVCLGAFVVVGGVVGFGIAPTLVSFVSNALGGERHLGAALATTGVSVGLISFVAFVVSFRNTPPSPGGLPPGTPSPVAR